MTKVSLVLLLLVHVPLGLCHHCRPYYLMAISYAKAHVQVLLFSLCDPHAPSRPHQAQVHFSVDRANIFTHFQQDFAVCC